MKNNFDHTTVYISIPKKDTDDFESILDKNDIYDYEVTVAQREFGPFGSIECIDYHFYHIDFGKDFRGIVDMNNFISKKPMTDDNDGRTIFYVHNYEKIGRAIGDFWLCYQYSLVVEIDC